jgi:hypothetical protein
LSFQKTIYGGFLMQKINKKTGEINSIQPGGLYAALPIPAYQVLARMGDHKAKDVLICIVSHLGLNGTCSYPSYTTIAAEAGMSRNTIRKSLDVLEEYGFIKTAYFREGKKDRNKYYIQRAAYDTGLMNKYAKRHRGVTAGCRRCGQFFDRGSYGVGPLGATHFGCGGSVKEFRKRIHSLESLSQ